MIHKVEVKKFPALLTFYIYIAKVIEMSVLIDRYRAMVRTTASEKYPKLAQKLGQLQPFMAVFLLECMGQLASSGPT
jgi:hypothetical protein